MTLQPSVKGSYGINKDSIGLPSNVRIFLGAIFWYKNTGGKFRDTIVDKTTDLKL